MKTGLTLGKFAPFHKGHQSLIETAIRETDHMIVLVYDAPETTRVPLPVRAGWIRTLYPPAEVVEAWDGPTVIGDSPEIKKLNEDFILRTLKGRDITHFYSSEFYGEHVSLALGALDRRVDPDRSRIPVSGTLVRSRPFNYRKWLDPIVYNDLIARAVFLGAPSTGKTTLCRALADRFQTVWMPEYGREYWERHQKERRLSQEQLLEIAKGHCEREDALVMDSREYLFVDTDATTTRMFSLYYHGGALPELDALADETIRRYDLFFLCEDDVPYDETWDRSGEANRETLQKQIKADLLQRKIPYIAVKGSLKSRIEQVEKALDRFDKWESMMNSLLHCPANSR